MAIVFVSGAGRRKSTSGFIAYLRVREIFSLFGIDLRALEHITLPAQSTAREEPVLHERVASLLVVAGSVSSAWSGWVQMQQQGRLEDN
jgi:hypothetical protein